jgi:hypothetical protein
MFLGKAGRQANARRARAPRAQLPVFHSLETGLKIGSAFLLTFDQAILAEC